MALAALLCAAFFSCSADEGSGIQTDANAGKVVFAVSPEMVRAVRSSANGVSKALDSSIGNLDDFKLEIKLSGGVALSQTVAVKEGAVVSFNDISNGTIVKASGIVYKKLEGSDKKIVYEGETANFFVQDYTPVKLDLTRIYYITFNPNEGVWTNGYPQKDSYKKGSPIKLPTSNDISREGWVFAGWCTSDDGGQTLQKFTFTDETKGDFTLYAKWVESAVQGISVTVDRDASDIEISYEAVDDPAAGPCVRFTATTPELPAGADSFAYDWFVDNRRVEGFAAEYLFVKTGMAKDVYDVSVRVNAMTGDGTIIKTWSAFAQVKVE